MKKLFLDTSVVIDFLRRKDQENSLLFLFTQESYSLAISIITHAEVFSGRSVWETEKVYAAVEKVCSGLSIVSLEKQISKRAGKIRAQYGTALEDSIIAATAIDQGLQLVTLNTKHFEKIKELTLWIQE